MFFLLTLTSCKSNNEGKIVGKWKSSSTIKELPAGIVFFEFKADNTFVMTALGQQIMTASYKLRFGDSVELNNVTPKTPEGYTKIRVKVKIDGDNLVWTEEGGTYSFVRDN